jgi:shikimate dehydrogenase
VELALAGAKAITIVNRSRDSAQALVNLLNEKTGASAGLRLWNSTVDVPADTDIVINVTSIGLYPDVDGRLDLDLASLAPNMVVADGIHNPPRTHLIRGAEARGCRVLDGLGMLVNQGVIGIKYWTGVDVDASVMRRTLEEILYA